MVFAFDHVQTFPSHLFVLQSCNPNICLLDLPMKRNRILSVFYSLLEFPQPLPLTLRYFLPSMMTADGFYYVSPANVSTELDLELLRKQKKHIITFFKIERKLKVTFFRWFFWSFPLTLLCKKVQVIAQASRPACSFLPSFGQNFSTSFFRIRRHFGGCLLVLSKNKNDIKFCEVNISFKSEIIVNIIGALYRLFRGRRFDSLQRRCRQCDILNAIHQERVRALYILNVFYART